MNPFSQDSPSAARGCRDRLGNRLAASADAGCPNGSTDRAGYRRRHLRTGKTPAVLFELGYRYATIGGDQDMYRSTVNYTDGIRLLSGLAFDPVAKRTRRKWFDEILINTLGLGNDPYESATVRIEKNRWYRYDMLWRSDVFLRSQPRGLIRRA